MWRRDHDLRKRISELEDRGEIERFGVRRFMASDSDMRFYTGLPDYATFVSLYNFVKPRPGFSLNYYNGYTNAAKHPSYVVSRGRPRNHVFNRLTVPYFDKVTSRFAGKRPRATGCELSWATYEQT